MSIRLLVVLVYLLGTLAVGLIFRRVSSRSREEFFLAGRGVSGLLLFFTLAATNFSAFTIFGVSGAGYRIGYAFFPVMAFGTGFMALTFVAIGGPVHRLSRRRGYITPSDFITDRYRSAPLKALFSLVLVVFTLPYIAIQAVTAGKSLNALVGIPYLAGAMLITGFVVLYVTLGGMRTIIWTDLIQAAMMIGFTLTAFFLIARRSGGFLQAQSDAWRNAPGLFSRPGQDGSLLPGVWLGYMLLWLFADPMLPQLFQRFLAARNERSLKTAAVLYPLVCTLLFFLTVSIGVIGRAVFPGLSAGESDNVFTLLLARHTGALLGTILFTGSLAALMSTMDSQLLTLTSMITVDFFRPRERRVLIERAVTVALGVLGLLIAVRPPQSILGFISRTTFNGLSVLAPTVIGGLYWRRANRYGAMASILVGEALVAAFAFDVLRVSGTMPVVPILVATTLVFVTTSMVTTRLAARAPGEETGLVTPVSRRGLYRALPLLLLFLLGNDFWAWGREPRFAAGLPLWVWYHLALGLLLALAFRLLLPAGKPTVTASGSGTGGPG